MKSYVQIITGYSGAGKTTVLKALEDNGFFCVDNLPIALLPAFFEGSLQDHAYQKIALGIDVRNSSSLASLVTALPTLRPLVGAIKIIFLTSATSQLLKRFQETRRKHPLANGVTLIEAIEQEKQLLQPLLERADVIVDTGNFTIHQLRTFVKTSFEHLEKPAMVINVMSFGFKYGVPQECNYVYDLRSLPNPHFVADLRGKTGLDSEVKQYLFGQAGAQEYWHKLKDFVDFSIRKSYEEGRFFIHIALGCTGGRHRSVAFVEELAQNNRDGVIFVVTHRDIDRKEQE